MSATAVYRRADRCVFRCLRGAVLVADPGREPQRLDGAAAAVWMALWSPCPAGELLARLDAARPEVAAGREVAAGPELARRPDLAHEAVSLLVAADLVSVDVMPVEGP